MGGNTKQAKGRAKQAVGAVTGNRRLQREGKREERVGTVQEKADDATDAVHDKVDDLIQDVADSRSTS